MAIGSWQLANSNEPKTRNILSARRLAAIKLIANFSKTILEDAWPTKAQEKGPPHR